MRKLNPLFLKSLKTLTKIFWMKFLGFVFFITLSTQLFSQTLIPFSGSNSVTCGTNTTLCTHAGCGVTYSDYANGYTILNAAFSAVINITGTYTTESCCDHIIVYSGSGTGGTQLLNLVGTGSINYTGLPGETLTVQFTSDGSVVYTGLNATVTYSGLCVSCTTPPAPTSISSNPASISCGSSANIKATSVGNTIHWYTVPTGGVLIGSSASNSWFPVSPLVTTTYYAESYNGCVSLTRVPITITVVPLTAPTPVTATPPTITCGGISNLNGISVGNTIKWYTVPTGGVAIGSSLSGVNYPVSPPSTTTYYAETNVLNSGSVTFNYTGSVQTWTVPVGVTSIDVDLKGAQGGAAISAGGLGGRVQATYPVMSGQVLNIYVGGTTTTITGGYNGGGNGANISYNRGGGGASDIRIGGTALTDRKLIAGGGGGAGYNCGSAQEWGGNGGDLTAQGGFECNTQGIYATGGSQIAGGLNIGGLGTNGALGIGGNCTSTYGGGGGGGYYGGGGASYGGGGGGSSYTDISATGVIHTQGSNSGDGQIIISWNSLSCVSLTRTPVTVTVTTPTAPTAVTATPPNICPGGVSNLNATTTGTNVNWYTVPTGGTPIGNSLSGVNFAVSPGSTTTYYAETNISNSGTQTFNYTGSIVNWTVPAGVTSINVTAKGAQGGQYGIGNPGGSGAIVTGTIAVTPSQVLSILVGQQPPPNLSVMPGGGGGSYVGLGASYATATPLIVAGGGGGSYSGGAGQSGQLVNITTTGDGGGPVPGTSGNGAASTTCGGGGGGFFTSGGNDITYGTAGAGGAGFRQGGAGGVSTSGYQTGGFGGGATADYVGACNTTAGSGGGYSGGSGQNSGAYITSGYAGGSYNSGTSQSNSVGNTGNGQVIISWASTSCTSSTRTPVTVTVGLPGAPTPVTATPATLCGPGTSNLNATSTGNTITWYTVPTGGTTIGTSLSGANFAVTPAVTTTYYAEATAGGTLSGSQTFSFTGAQQTWTVPSGVTSITVDVIGAEGGTNVGGSGTSVGGLGGRVQGTIAVTPGNTIYVNVGGKGGNSGTSSLGGFNGGGNGGNVTYCAGGGGASDLRLNGTLLANRIFVGAGGGGAGTNCWGNGDLGGNGGGLTGAPGCQCSSCVGGTPSYPGAGGSQIAGGLLGNDQGQGCTQSGTLGIGGNGACTYGGGGGGGYYGGGGAGYGGGGGGSSYADPTATGVVHTQGYQTGNGLVVISWTGFAGCSSATRTPVTVTVSPATVGGAVTGGSAICLGNMTPLLTLSGQTGTVVNWEVSSNGGSTWTTIANTGTTYQTVITVGGTYWYRAVVQSGTCASQFSNYTVVTVPTMTVISPTTGTSGMCNIMSPNSWVYILDPVDKLIAGVFDATGGNNLMNTTAYLYIDPTVQIHPYSGEPYLQRHFQITPVSSGIADVKLYFTQAEFNALQVAVPTLTGIGDLAVTKFDDTGLWQNAVYYGSPIATANDPWPGVHSLQITVTSFSKFYIHPKTLGTPLPVGLLSFTGKCEDSKATLNWSTSSELNNDYFSVERTRNGEQWDLVATVKGAGNSNTIQNYSYVDENPLKGNFYYRISQTDFDGTTKLFEPIAITCASTAYEVNVFPNPFNEELVVSYKNMTSDKAEVKVIDVLGNVVNDSKYQLKETGNDSFIINLGSLAPGLYYFEFKAGDYNYRTRVVKN